MKTITCPYCGGKLHIVIETGLAVCEACQRTFDADPKDVQKYGGIVRDAGKNNSEFASHKGYCVRPAMWIDLGVDS